MKILPIKGPLPSMKSVAPAIRDAWSTVHEGLGELPDSYEQALRHEVGDTLADFLIIELFEGHENKDLTDERTIVDTMQTVVEKTIDELKNYSLELDKQLHERK